MKRFFCILLSVLLVAALFGCAGEESPETPNESKGTAPDFTVLDESGNRVKLSDFYGKPVVLNFWATWCYYCKVEMPDFDRAAQAYPDVQFLMVNATDGVDETVESAKAYVEAEGYSFDIFFDTAFDAINAYGITGFPTTFFIDANGDVVTYQRGMISYDVLERGIKMIAGE